MNGHSGLDLEAPRPDLAEHGRRQLAPDPVALEVGVHLGVDEDDRRPVGSGR